MARRKQTTGTIAQLMNADKAARTLMAEYICRLRETNDPDLEVKEQIVREAMTRLSVHDMDLFDEEIELMALAKKEGVK